jgi:hypothetical protein
VASTNHLDNSHARKTYLKRVFLSADTAGLQKDWIVMLTSTGGIILTLSLAVLAIVFTADPNPLLDWQKIIVSLAILTASFFLVICTSKALNALGALIMVASLKDKAEKLTLTAQEMEIVPLTKAEFIKTSQEAQSYFKLGLYALFVTVGLSCIFLIWNTI